MLLLINYITDNVSRASCLQAFLCNNLVHYPSFIGGNMSNKINPRYCLYCGMIFFANVNNTQYSKQKWCSRECMNRKPYKFINNGECIECVSHAPYHEKGYASIIANGKIHSMSRYVYEKVHGKIPEGLMMRHKCDNPKCVNINHLETGTNMDNVNDMMSRNRNPKGEQKHNSKLTGNQVIQIRSRPNDSHALLAREFNVAHSTISKIRRNKIWKHITITTT